MLVLDTDHMSLLEWGGEGSAALRERLADVAPDQVATTIINYEEQMRGWMAYIARAKSMAQRLEAYQRLRRHLENYRQVPVLDFDEVAAEEFQRLRRARIRIGTMDLNDRSHRVIAWCDDALSECGGFRQGPGVER